MKWLNAKSRIVKPLPGKTEELVDDFTDEDMSPLENMALLENWYMNECDAVKHGSRTFGISLLFALFLGSLIYWMVGVGAATVSIVTTSALFCFVLYVGLFVFGQALVMRQLVYKYTVQNLAAKEYEEQIKLLYMSASEDITDAEINAVIKEIRTNTSKVMDSYFAHSPSIIKKLTGKEPKTIQDDK